MDAFAQIGGAGGAAGSNPMISTGLMLLQFLPIFLIIYLLIIRPQQKRQKDLEKMLKALKKGDKVLTSGGLYGTVVGLDDAKTVLKVADDVKLEFARSAIVQVIGGDAKA
jgi:preprotein translocase subunit YajC